MSFDPSAPPQSGEIRTVPLSVRSKLEGGILDCRMLGRSFDLIYLNTASAAHHLPVLSSRGRSILWHIHELEYALRKSIGDQQIHQVFALATRFIVVSQSVREALIKKFEVHSDKIDLVHGFIGVPSVSPASAQSFRRRIHDDFGWPENAFVIGGCGALGWRKGTDLFLQIAETVLKADTGGGVRFVWVGGGSTDEKLRFEHDIRALKLQNHCRYVPATAQVMDYYHAMDVFALTSREDPFPLVMLEAGSRRLPVVCFAGSGGGPEFVGDDAGVIVPYLDVTGFAQCLHDLRNSPELCRRLGAAASEKVRSRHTIDVQGPKMVESIERCLATSA
jgi:glycosyltransferase involved in cell wall biosynthesis